MSNTQTIREPKKVAKTDGNVRCYQFSINIYEDDFQDAVEELKYLLADESDAMEFTAKDVSE